MNNKNQIGFCIVIVICIVSILFPKSIINYQTKYEETPIRKKAQKSNFFSIRKDSTYLPEDLVGKYYVNETVLNGYNSGGGGIISNTDLHWNTTYMVGFFEFKNMMYMFLEMSGDYGVLPSRLILDVIKLDLQESERWGLPLEIYKNGEAIYDAVVIGVPNNDGILSPINRVWEVDTRINRLIEKDPSDYRCELEFY